MSGVPNVFGSATSSIPLSQLDVNFNTPLYIGNTSVGLGNTVTSLGNVTLTNPTIIGGTSTANATAIVNGTSNVSVVSSGGAVTISTNGTSNAVVIDTNQMVGIGTSSPSTKLTVYDATTPQVTFNNGTSTFIVGNSSGGNNKILYGTGAYPMIFYTNATEP